MSAVVEAICAGDVRACAKLISQIERADPASLAHVRALYLHGGRSRIIGITGPPGAGKSTLVGRLITHYRSHGLRVAVLAIDPSSPLSGGSILGDRLRLSEHSIDLGVFIRSMAARGRLGGLAKAAGDALTVLDAMPWDRVLVETVGVGQNETEIMRHASAVVLLQTPMGGDDVQAAKAGVMEIADIFAVNKGDHPDAERTVRTLRRMLALVEELNPGRPWHPPVVKTQALDGSGVEDLAQQIDAYFQMLSENAAMRQRKRREQVKERVLQIVRERAERYLNTAADPRTDAWLDAAVIRKADPYDVADQLMALRETMA
jgi:LAO/AO transport system kinase